MSKRTLRALRPRPLHKMIEDRALFSDDEYAQLQEIHERWEDGLEDLSFRRADKNDPAGERIEGLPFWVVSGEGDSHVIDGNDRVIAALGNAQQDVLWLLDAVNGMQTRLEEIALVLREWEADKANADSPLAHALRGAMVGDRDGTLNEAEQRRFERLQARRKREGK